MTGSGGRTADTRVVYRLAAAFLGLPNCRCSRAQRGLSCEQGVKKWGDFSRIGLPFDDAEDMYPH